MKKKKIRLILITLGIVLILMVGYRLYLGYQTDVQLFLNSRASKEELLAHIRSHGFSASLLLVVLTAVTCAVPGILTSIIGVIAGLNLGPSIGAGVNVLGNALGNISAMSLTHRSKFLDKKTEKNHWVQSAWQMRYPKIDVVLGCMIPVIPPSMVNFVADAMRLSPQQIVMLIVIEAIPSPMLYVCGGEALLHGYNKTAVTSAANVTVLVGSVVFTYKDRKKKQGK